jgi:ISXO2-like transposase domain
VHTNTVENSFSILKRGIYGVYRYVSEARLRRYVSKFDLRYSNRKALGANDVQRADFAILGARGRRLLI